VSDLQNWYDASDPLNTSLSLPNTTTVGTWYDKSGNGNNTISSAGPAITKNNDGHDYLNFNFSNFSIPALSWQANNTYFTIFMVETTTDFYNPNSGVSGVGFLGSSLGNGDTFYGGPSFGNAYVWGLNTLNIFTGYSPPGQIWITNITRMWSLTYTGSYGWYLNGVALTSSATRTQNTTSFINQIGYSQGQGGYNYNGKMREILMYRGDIGTSNRQKIEGYLAYKWGINGSLPVSHPYYSAAPIPGSITTWNISTNLKGATGPTGPVGGSIRNFVQLSTADTITLDTTTIVTQSFLFTPLVAGLYMIQIPALYTNSFSSDSGGTYEVRMNVFLAGIPSTLISTESQQFIITGAYSPGSPANSFGDWAGSLTCYANITTLQQTTVELFFASSVELSGSITLNWDSINIYPVASILTTSSLYVTVP
jgi:hypothetical protein